MSRRNLTRSSNRPRFAALIALALFSSSVSGCGGDSSKPLPASPANANPNASARAPVSTTPAGPAAAKVEPAALDVDPTSIELTKEGVTRGCDAGLRRAEISWESIRALAKAPDDHLTWENTMGAFDAIHLAARSAGDYQELIAVAHPDKAVRDAAKECSPKVDRLTTSVLLDDATVSVIRRYAAIAGKKAPLSPVRARFLDRTLKEFHRNGAELDAAGKARLRELNDELSTATQDFSSNLASATLSVDLEPKSLEGLPATYIEKHPKGDGGKVRITTDYPDFFPFMQFAKDRKAALDLYTLFDNRAADKNVPLLERILKLRKEKAKLLGYATWADFVLELRMAKDPATVAAFLDDLQKYLAPIVKTELGELEAANVKLGGGARKGDALLPSDRLYLEEVVRKAKYGVDAKEVSEYFEVERVRKGLLDVTSELFGITFREVPSAKTWHPDVKTYEVLDRAPSAPNPGGAGERVLGRFYMDLYPREGKYKHAAVFSIRDTRTMEDGSRLMPIASIVCNFPRTTATGPGLMTHQEVSTFFHEFGHVLHHVLSRAELSTFAGSNVARDFVEAPSQMLEEWTWSKPVLDRFAHHYKTDKPIPPALFAKMTKGRAFGRATGTERQIFLAELDQAYHAVAEPPSDTTATLREVWAKTMPFRFVEGTHFQATFGHLMEYDAGYYGYQWALAIARDLFSRFDKEGLMAQATALDYRKKVLERGSSDDESALVESFLGRPFSRDPYKKFLAMGAKPSFGSALPSSASSKSTK